MQESATCGKYINALITMLLPGYGRPVGRFLRQRLNTGFLVVGHRDRPRLANLAAQQSFIENLYFLVVVPPSWTRVPSLHRVTNLMRATALPAARSYAAWRGNAQRYC